MHNPILPGKQKKLFKSSMWEVLDHPPDGRDLATSDFHLFRKLKDFLGGKRYTTGEVLKEAVTTFLNEVAAEVYDEGI